MAYYLLTGRRRKLHRNQIDNSNERGYGAMKAQDVCIEDGEPPDGRPASMCIETVHVDAQTGHTGKTGRMRVPQLTTVSGFLTNSATLRFRRTFYKDV
ncbi:MAG: hypothetical protein QME27_06405, partial [Syntrophaceae bacterium]|nr:hypothetical protein [Syntrophaceae bacterium]